MESDRGEVLLRVDPEHLHVVWPRVRPGLERVRAHSGDTWIPEDVYSALRAGTSWLHLGYRDGEYVGFVVSTPTLAFDGRALHVWCVYCTGGVEAFLPALEKIARDLGARRLTFSSPRKGWERKRLGFRITQVCYAKELS